MFAVPPNTIALAATAPNAHPALIARAYAADRPRWGRLLRYDPDQRFVALVDRTDEQEVWLMSWLPGQETDLHDHGSTSGAFTIVSGELTEEVLRAPRSAQRTDVHHLVAGQSRVFGPGYVHRFRNAGVDPAISIHVYRGVRTVRSYLPDARPVDHAVQH